MLMARQAVVAADLSPRAGPLGAAGREHQKTQRQQNLFSITVRSVPQHVRAEVSDQRHVHLSGLYKLLLTHSGGEYLPDQ